MRIKFSAKQPNHSVVTAFTLPEVMVAVVVMLATFGGFYLGVLICVG